jgi:hypothetical protein
MGGVSGDGMSDEKTGRAWVCCGAEILVDGVGWWRCLVCNQNRLVIERDGTWLVVPS